MAKGKEKTVFFCTECGGESVRWMGKCPYCGAWNSLVEEKVVPEAAPKAGRVQTERVKAQPIRSVSVGQSTRWQTEIAELDTVLGGGLIPGSSVLLGGEPGIGKSTLLLQAAAKVSSKGPVLYLSGEESAEQIRLRADRLDALAENIYLLAQTDMDAALEEARALKPVLLIVDSVQALYLPGLDSAPGSVSQVRAVAAAAISFARESGAAVMLIGHVTKEGQLAGPRVLEHMVDAVLYFEGDRYHAFRLLRAVKNRFGSTNEVGVFEMAEQGLLPVTTPSAYFLANRGEMRPGAAVSCVMQGSRPLLLEIQALVSTSNFGNPRRLATGFDYNRLLLIIAVLERKMGLALGNKDVYLNVAGGMRVDDPACDLACAAAICSALLEQPLEEDLLVVGELGLLGELRPVPQQSRRAKEAAAFQFARMLCPPGQEKAAGPLRRLEAKDLASALATLGFLTQKG